MKNNLYKFLLCLLCMIALYFVSFNSIRKYSSSDPQLTLLTSQALLEHGTTNLYSYYTKVTPDDFADGTWKYSYWQREKKVYYFYPIGTSILCIPIVGIARLGGYDMSIKADDALWQSVIASLCVSVIFLLLVMLAQHYFTFYKSVLLALLLCSGTTIASTVGLALWSFNFELIFLLLSILHLSKTHNEPEKIQGKKLGLFLYTAWLCRPSTLIVFAIVSVWLFRVNKKALKQFLLTLVLLYLPFGIYSITHFNLVVPAYYHPLFWTHMPSSDAFLNKFLAVWFSPARGLFLFTPVLVLALVGLFQKETRHNSLYLLSLIWFIIHTVMLARQANWWGGWSFGPRLFTDALVPLITMIFISCSSIRTKKSSVALFVVFITLSIPGVWIHTVKGANDVSTFKWNDTPPIDENIDQYIWNMEYPQFMADSISNLMKGEEFVLLKQLKNGMPKLKKGDLVFFNKSSIYSEAVGKKVNALPAFSSVQLTCDARRIAALKKDTFCITPDLYERFSKDSNYVMAKSDLRSLVSYINKHKTEHIFIATKFDLFNKMSAETKKYFEANAPYIFKLREGEGIVMHIYNGVVIQETFPNRGVASFEYMLSGHTINARTDGKTSASIKLNGKECCFNDGGFNVVCFNGKAEITDVARFNTHFIDAEYLYLFKVYKK